MMILENSRLSNKFDSAIRFFLYVVLFWLPYSSAAIEIGVIISLVLWILKHSCMGFNKEYVNTTFFQKFKIILSVFKPEQSFLNFPIMLFLIACFVSVIFGVTPFFSLRAFFTKTLEWFVVFFLVIEVFKSKKQILIASGVFAFTSLAVLVDGFVQYYFTNKDFFMGHEILTGGRASASFRTPNGFGAYLTIILPLLTSSLFLKIKDKKIKWGFYVLLILSVWSLINTYSRGAWVGSFFGILFLFFYILYLKKLKAMRYFFIFFVSALFLGAVFFTITRTSDGMMYKHRFQTARWRVVVWEESIKMVRERPVFGYGVNTFMREFQPYYKQRYFNHEHSPTYAHNCYIQLLVETGLFGISMFLWMLIVLFKNSLKNIRDFYLTDNNLVILLLGLLSGIFAFLVHSFFDTNFYSLQLSIYIWFMVGFLFSIRRIIDSSNLDNI